MNKKYKIKKNYKTYEIIKDSEEIMTVEEIYNILNKLIKEGKSDYNVFTEGFCVGINGIEICDIDKNISF